MVVSIFPRDEVLELHSLVHNVAISNPGLKKAIKSPDWLSINRGISWTQRPEKALI
jgi:hypothetical protein